MLTLTPKGLNLSFMALGVSILGHQAVLALPKPLEHHSPYYDGYLNSKPNHPLSVNQVTSVSELQDVEPTTWAYEALRSLVERYGCIVGYPGRTFRVSFLEDHQFSTTTTLTGEVVLGLTGVASGQKNEGSEEIPQIPTLGYRTRLELNTSFTGRDRLYTRLATGTIADLSEEAGTFQATLGFSQPDNGNVAIEVLNYNFLIGDQVNIWIEATGGAFDDFTNTLNVLDGDGASGAISAFGTRNPIYYQGEGTGIGIQANLGVFDLSLGYLASDASDPSQGNGLFNGGYGAIAQLGYIPSETFGIAVVYGQGYNTLDTGTGSRRSNFQYFSEEIYGESVSTLHHSYGVSFSWQLAEQFVLGGWGGYTNASTLNAVENEELGTLSRVNLDIWQWAVTLAFPDAFKEGSIGGIILGMQPWVSNSSSFLPEGERVNDGDTSFHIEAFYSVSDQR